jgi:hypothetical protein
LNSSLHGGTGWEKLEVNYPVTDDISELTASVRTTTGGSAITFYIQVVFVPKVPSNDHTYAIDSDQDLVVLDGTLRVSGLFNKTNGDVGRFAIEIKRGAWETVKEATRAIRIKTGAHLNGRVIEYTGWINHTALTAATTTWPANDIYILDVAEAIARSAIGGRLVDDSPRATDIKAGRYGLVVEKVLSDVGTRPSADWKGVEPS